MPKREESERDILYNIAGIFHFNSCDGKFTACYITAEHRLPKWHPQLQIYFLNFFFNLTAAVWSAALAGSIA